MSRVHRWPEDLLARLGEPWRDFLNLGPVFSSTQLAVALGVTEQTILSWIRQGRMPRPTFSGFASWYTSAEVQSLAGKAIDKPGTHHPTPEAEKRRLTTPSKRKPITTTKRKRR